MKKNPRINCRIEFEGETNGQVEYCISRYSKDHQLSLGFVANTGSYTECMMDLLKIVKDDMDEYPELI